MSVLCSLCTAQLLFPFSFLLIVNLNSADNKHDICKYLIKVVLKDDDVMASQMIKLPDLPLQLLKVSPSDISCQ